VAATKEENEEERRSVRRRRLLTTNEALQGALGTAMIDSSWSKYGKKAGKRQLPNLFSRLPHLSRLHAFLTDDLFDCKGD
jgi:hypothetical protein